jgi:4-hydroxybenzoate polyprenyltransferase
MDSSASHRPGTRWTVARAYLTLPHAVPIVVVMTATAAFALIAADGWPGTGIMIRLLSAMLGGQLVIGVVNELVDADLDAVSKPDKPIPRGLVSRRGALTMLGAGVLLLIGFGLSFGLRSFAVCAAGTGAGVAYSLWFKRTIWSWVPYLVALPLLPIWVWLTLDSVDSALFTIYPLGAAAIVAVQIAQSLPDIEADQQTGVRTLAVALGPHRAILVCWGALLLAALLAAGLAPLVTDRVDLVSAGVGAAVLLIALDGGLRKRDERLGDLACFPCVAVGTVALGLGWVAALALG